MSPRRLQVGINLLWLRPGVVGGSEHYIVSILSELASRSDSGVDVHLYVLPDFVLSHRDIAGRFITTVAPVSGRYRAARVAVENLWLARRAARHGVEVMHHAGGTMPRMSGPLPVLTLHDLQYLDFPEYFSKVKRCWLEFVVPRSAARARAIITASTHSRDRIVDSFGVDSRRVTVMAHAVPAAPQLGDPHRLAGAKPYVFFPAWTHPHKNHEVLIRAVAELTDVDLVLTGGRGAADSEVGALIRELGVGERVHRLGHVSGEQIEALYAGCLGVVFPSKYEGFGAPVAEAMVRGVPVIASTETSLPEVVGDGGLLVESHDVQGWAAAIDSLKDDGLRDELVVRGHERANAFAPAPIVDSMIAVWWSVS